MSERTSLIQGNVAIARGAIQAGCKFFAGYPITPSSEIAETMSEELPEVGGKFIQMEDEIASIGATIGASLAGDKAMTATSGPGFSLKQENLGFAVMAEIPLVVINIQRGGPSTGIPTKASQGDVMQARYGSHGDYPIIALSPASVKESFYMSIRAFSLAEKYRTPVIILGDEIIAHLTEKVTLNSEEMPEIIEREAPEVSPEKYLPYQRISGGVAKLAPFGQGYRYHISGLVHDETGFPTNDHEEAKKQLEHLNNKFAPHKDDIIYFEEHHTKDMDTLIVAYGAPARSARRALHIARDNGHKVGLLRLKTIWPFPDEKIENLLNEVKQVIVPEMNRGQIAQEIKKYNPHNKEIMQINKINGEPIRPDEILELIEQEG